jgi:hypothetical protein
LDEHISIDLHEDSFQPIIAYGPRGPVYGHARSFIVTPEPGKPDPAKIRRAIEFLETQRELNASVTAIRRAWELEIEAEHARNVSAVQRAMRRNGLAKLRAAEKLRRRAESRAASQRNEARTNGLIGHCLTVLQRPASRAERFTVGLGLFAARRAVETIQAGKLVIPGTVETLDTWEEVDGSPAQLVSTVGCEWVGGATRSGGVARVSDSSRDEAIQNAIAAQWAEIRRAGWRAGAFFRLVPSVGPLTESQLELVDGIGVRMVERIPHRVSRVHLAELKRAGAEIFLPRPRGVSAFLRHLRAARRAAQRAVSSLGLGMRGEKIAGGVEILGGFGSPEDWGKLTSKYPISPLAVPPADALRDWETGQRGERADAETAADWQDGNRRHVAIALRRAVENSGLLALIRRARTATGRERSNLLQSIAAVRRRLKLAASLLRGECRIDGNAGASARAALRDAVSLLLPVAGDAAAERAERVKTLASAFYLRA